MQLTSAGGFTNRMLYTNGSSYFMKLNGLTIDNNGDYVITGALLVTPNSGPSQTLIMKVSSVNLNPSWAELYGSNSNNAGFSIFTTSNGFVSAGISNDYTTTAQPQLLSVDANGHAGICYTDLTVGSVSDTNDAPSYSDGTPTSATATDLTVLDQDLCEEMYDLCSSSTAPQITGISNQSLSNDLVKIYPNPASDKLYIDLTNTKASKGQMVVKDALGKTVMTIPVNISSGTNHLEIDISGLRPGIYIVQIVSEDNLVNSVSKIEKN